MPNFIIGTTDPVVKYDPGAGLWNSEKPEAKMIALKVAILNYMVHATVLVGDDAAKHMLHYLLNSGKEYEFDLQGMVDEVESAKLLHTREAAEAKVFAETLPPGAYNIVASRMVQEYNRQIESKNWFFAVGGYSIWGKANLIVEHDGVGGKGYQMDFVFNCVDRYNWDKGKSVTIFNVDITDEFMGLFHRQGLAQEFNLCGQIKSQHKWGDKTVLSKMEPISSGR
ncbi:MAG: hypothetical protein L3J98_05720 [Gammaproteobacteria bacterium]|nr:hypothetical protein [Gammaproteobacteria bacterium]MCF6259646.1 hypothetical protein [Gammaproteobacteria bacterium]